MSTLFYIVMGVIAGFLVSTFIFGYIFNKMKKEIFSIETFVDSSSNDINFLNTKIRKTS